MSSSSSDSDSDDFEPIRRIKIHIKPKDTAPPSDGADVEAIKASVEAWRPLGPRPHPSLSRRQSSLSSMSSLSFGTPSGSNYSGSNIKAPMTMADSSSANINLNQYYPPGYGSNQGGATFNNNHTNNSMRSSPSCSSLVNEFTNRTSFSNFMPNASRTSSPLTFMNATTTNSDTVPIALAIQESIELTVKGQHKPALDDCDVKRQFDTRALGNIKVAFPNSFARLCSLEDGANKEQGAKQIPSLKLKLHSTENVIRYYASGLVKELDSEQSSLAESLNTPSNENNNNNNNHHSENSNSRSKDAFEHQQNFQVDPFDLNESPTKINYNSKVIEFDMDALVKHIKQLYDRSPNMRYYNVDVLRYQIAPIDQFEKCPLQVSAYWKLESNLIKLRIDFKHSNQSGFNLERLREIYFIANFNNLVPPGLSIKPIKPNQVSTLARPIFIKASSVCNPKLLERTSLDVIHIGNDNSYPLFGNGCQIIGGVLTDKPRQASNTNLMDISPPTLYHSTPPISHTQSNLPQAQPQAAPRQLNNDNLMQMRLPPPPSSGHSRHSQKSPSVSSNLKDAFQQPSSFLRNDSNNSNVRSDVLASSGVSGGSPAKPSDSLCQMDRSAFQPLSSHQPANATQVSSFGATNPARTPPSMPYITYEPHASWDNETRQLTWKFDNLLSYYKSDGSGSLLAKLDFRHCEHLSLGLGGAKLPDGPVQNQLDSPQPVDIKFMVVDSTLSKISLTIDSAGYRMSLLKKEIRSGCYKSEPCTF